MKLNRLISVAPMMDCTDRHYRYLVRLISRRVLLYTEMVTANAVIHGDRDELLGFDAIEHPVALQLGGSDPQLLAQAARIGQDWGYDEINLNVGCPSERVQSGQFGACLMKDPVRVAECVSAMQAAVNVPVTVKTRIGVDNQDSYEELCHFIETVSASGCQSFTLHARKAWLKGLSPKQNRSIPPLNYDRVYRLKQDFPHLEIIINGGINSHADIQAHLSKLDGVMIGRAAYSNIYWFSDIDGRYFNDRSPTISRKEVLLKYFSYLCHQVERGVSLRFLVKPMLGVFQGQPGAKGWRVLLCEKSRSQDGLRDIEIALRSLD